MVTPILQGFFIGELSTSSYRCCSGCVLFLLKSSSMLSFFFNYYSQMPLFLLPPLLCICYLFFYFLPPCSRTSTLLSLSCKSSLHPHCHLGDKQEWWRTQFKENISSLLLYCSAPLFLFYPVGIRKSVWRQKYVIIISAVTHLWVTADAFSLERLSHGSWAALNTVKQVWTISCILRNTIVLPIKDTPTQLCLHVRR